MSRFLCRYISFLLMIVSLTVSVTGACRDAQATELGCCTQQLPGNPDGTAESSPCHDEERDSSGCDSSCYCPGQAPLTPQHLQIAYSPDQLPLRFTDPLMFFPEVYLSKFIPPQNQV
ncbi:hypothetical protein [Geobacter sp. DSM 9736]|uniref:hypothetical protein n=1 Tax=Geobacter sp. DSM 9736 TaxID=1277350 RepID=UPI000B50EFD6|nr:hypothetical protein [Geobacter sp. DSM 9736]SNB44771.1 hypothetical protein SAMN06269301_0158 [Geobacter sp. DSM 9736]